MFRSLFRNIVGSWFGNDKCKELLLFVISSSVYRIRLFILKKKFRGWILCIPWKRYLRIRNGQNLLVIF